MRFGTFLTGSKTSVRKYLTERIIAYLDYCRIVAGVMPYLSEISHYRSCDNESRVTSL